MTSTISSTAIGSLFGMGGAVMGAVASTSFSYIASGYSSTPPDGSYGAVVFEATIERTKTVIGGYEMCIRDRVPSLRWGKPGEAI